MKTIYFIAITIIILSVVIFFLACGCSKVFNAGKDDPLVLPLQLYNGNQLRTDGYYYYEYSPTGTINRDVYFLYRNGVLLSLGVITPFKDESGFATEDSFRNPNFINIVSKNKYNWGIFNINGDNIAFEKWYPPDGGGWHAYIREGKILNDTTFHITSSYRMVNGQKTEVSTKDEIYHFKEFSPKPDSANNFIK